jgi:hypothetical protein
MKKITIISVLLATAVIMNVTAQRRTSSNEERSVKGNTNERSYSDKSPRSQSNKSYNRSSTTSRASAPDTRRKEVKASSRKVEATRSATSPAPNTRNRATTRTSSHNNNSRSQSTEPGRSTRVQSNTNRESRSANQRTTTNSRSRATTNSTSNSRTIHSSRDVTNTNRPRVANSGKRVDRQSTTTVNRGHHSGRNEVNANRSVKHYPTHRKYVRTKKHVHVHVHKPRPIEYRARYYPYRRPVHVNIVWTPRVYRDYCVIYPEIKRWRYHRHYTVHTISAYNAYYHMGEVRRVYGKVSDTYYAYETDEYFLYVGARFPYQDFTVVVPGYIARDFHRRPQRYFLRNHIEVTGLITSFEGEPEMVVKRHHQINVY